MDVFGEFNKNQENVAKNLVGDLSIVFKNPVE
jgi:hypothetical protein